MTNYELTIRQLNSVRSNLESQLKEIKNAGSISYASWDSDTRDAYQSILYNIEKELNSIANEVNNLKQYVYKEDA